jgi:hypothetical protein
MNPGAIEEGERTEAVQALNRALDAAAEIDVHAQAMAEERAQRRADQTAAPALTPEPNRHAGASLAYDIAARQVLEACEAITRALLPPQA